LRAFHCAVLRLLMGCRGFSDNDGVIAPSSGLGD
jgi:hypothetical protein